MKLAELEKMNPFITGRDRRDSLFKMAEENGSSSDKTEDEFSLNSLTPQNHSDDFFTGCKEKESEKDFDKESHVFVEHAAGTNIPKFTLD